MPQGTCSIDECDKPQRGHGWCTAHLTRWRRHGDPLGGARDRGSTVPFLLGHVDDPHSDDDPCVVWPEGWAVRNGYGELSFEGQIHIAHRLLLSLRDGPPPPGKPYAIHGPCHDKRCLIHVRWGTPTENSADKVRDGSHNRGERCPTSKLREVDVRAIRSGFASGESRQALALAYNVRRQTIGDIIQGRTWRSVV